MELRRWTIVDAQGQATYVVLDGLETGVPLDRELFRFRNPQFYPERAQLAGRVGRRRCTGPGRVRRSRRYLRGLLAKPCHMYDERTLRVPSARERMGTGMETIRAYLRTGLDHLFRPFAWLLLACRVTPNQVSLMGILLNLVTAWLIVDGQLLLAGLMYLLAGGLDLLDGILARLAKMATRFGAFLDSTADRISEGVVFAAIAYHFAHHGQPLEAAVAVLALLGSLAGQLHPRPRRGARPGVQGRHRHPRRAGGPGRLRPDVRAARRGRLSARRADRVLDHPAHRPHPAPAASPGLSAHGS